MRPQITVCVASHDRPLRLRWLLNALEEQTLERGRWEVVVAHDSAGPETDRLLAEHPLAADGTLRALSFPPGPGPAAKRNAAWRAARAPVVAFTDDDCRPPETWLERLVAASERHPGAVLQGAVRPDPDEAHLLVGAPYAHSIVLDPPTVEGQTCNVAYPRVLLERVGGFDERYDEACGEDTDLACRVRATGAPWVAAEDAVTFHAVVPSGLGGRLRTATRWVDLPLVARRHPEFRRRLVGRVFWKPTHAWMALALAGAALGVRRPAALLLLLPWVLVARPRYGRGARGLVRAASELPGRAAIDLVEIAALARGSVRHRTVML